MKLNIIYTLKDGSEFDREIESMPIPKLAREIVDNINEATLKKIVVVNDKKNVVYTKYYPDPITLY